MKKVLAWAGILLCMHLTALNAQVIFSENFETTPGPGFPTGWTLFNVDGRTPNANVGFVNNAWVVYDDLIDTTNECATSTSWYNPVGAADDWMFTPPIALTSNTKLSWDAIAYDNAYPDGYEVRIALGSPTVANALANAALFTVTAENPSWTSRSVNLQSMGYANQTVYIAFRNNSNDQYLLAIDNIMVEALLNYDAAITAPEYPSEYTIIPLSQIQPFTLAATVSNNGVLTVNNATLTVNVYNGSFANVYSAVSAVQPVLAAGASVNLSVPDYTPPAAQPDVYFFEYIVSIQQNDDNRLNDTAYLSVLISDTVYARDDGVVTAGLGSGDSGGYIGQQFDLVNPASINSVLFYVTRGYRGLRLRANIWNMAGGAPNIIIGNTTTMIYPDDSARVYVLGIAGGPLQLSSGTYTVTLEEMDTTVALGQTDEIYTPGTTWVDFPGNPFGTWANNEDFGAVYAKPYALRINLGCAAPVITTTSTDNTLCIGANGSATASASGAITYSWSNGALSPSISGLSAGSYTVTIADANGCSGTKTVTISNNLPVIMVTVASTQNTQCTPANGTATAIPSGGTSPYSYQWNAAAGNQTTQTATGLSGGTYSVTAMDANGCSGSATVNVTSTIPVITINLDASSPNTQCGTPNGTASVSASGGIGPYTFTWSNGFVGANATMLGGGDYNITATDNSSGCTGTATITIGSTTPPVNVTVTATANTNCVNPNGSASASPTNYVSYQWSNGQSGVTVISNLDDGTYAVTVTDNNGCTGTGNATVVDNITSFAVSVTAQSVTSCLTDNGMATASVNPVVPVSYVWGTSPPQSGATATNLSVGTYLVTATHISTGCFAIGVANITDGRPHVSVAITSSNPVTHCVNPNGSATAVASGSPGGFTYLWSPGGQTTATAVNLATGSYTVVATDNNGCSASVSVTIADNRASVSVTVNVVSNVTRCTNPNGSVQAVPAPPGTYTYSWSPGGGTSASLNNLDAGTYSVTVTDNNGCSAAGSAIVGISVNFPTAAATATNETSASANDGTATVTASGGTGSYTYSWNTVPVQTTATATGLDAGTYTVTVTDQAGCTAAATVTVGTSVGIGGADDVLSFLLFPNPASDAVHLKLELNDSRDVAVAWYNMLGETVMTRKDIKTQSLQARFDFSALPQGIYMVRIKVGDEVMTARVTLVK